MTHCKFNTISKRVVSAIMCLCFVIVLVKPISAKDAQHEIYTATLGYRQMETDAQRAAYVKIAKMILSYDREGIVFGPEEGVTRNDVANILRFIPYDYPEAFYFRGSCSLAENDGTIFIVPLYTTNVGGKMSVDEKDAVIAKQKDQFEVAVMRIVNNIPSYVDTDEEKSKYIFEYLASNVSYEAGDHDQTAYGALVEGKCVCAGYAAAYTVLMRKLGVNTWMVTGEAYNGEYTGPHAWNVSWIDGKCVYTDPTWGDGESKVRYQYLNISGKKMNESHTWDNVYDTVLYECDHNLQGDVTPAVKVTGIILNSTNKKMTSAGQTWQIAASVVPTNATNKKLTYSSDNKDVARVNSSGQVTATGEGTAKITIRSEDGGALATVTITVDYPHKHSLKKVELKMPTCTNPGYEKHFVCDGCGSIFKNASAKDKLTDISQITINPTGHEPGNNSFDNLKHWVECKNCSLVSKLEDHQLDDNGKCTKCNYQREFSEEVPKETNPVNPTEPPESQPQTPTTESGIGNSEGKVPTSDNGTHAPGQTDASETNGKHDGMTLAPKKVIIVAIAIIGIFAVAILLISAKSKD